MEVNLLTPTSLRSSTLSATSCKEGEKGKNNFSKPLSAAAEERVIQRSADRVSKLYERY
jgi:hypothetical protein